MVAYETFMNFLKEKGCQDIFNEAFQTQAPGYRLDAKLWDILGGDEYIYSAGSSIGRRLSKDVSSGLRLTLSGIIIQLNNKHYGKQ